MYRPLMQATLGAFVACAALLIGCSTRVVTRDMQSPDGRLILRIEVNESGGAAVPDVTSAFVLAAQPSGARKEQIFKGSAMSYFSASWKTSREVMLSFNGGYVTTCTAVAVVPPDFKVGVLGCK